mmetsp:Transcript_4116/g.7592  ORF Transcript_4116/g.7592 Transcript_4116/m.7592 type:complete len:175 (-) Transcript_4116:141-665(-)
MSCRKGGPTKGAPRHKNTVAFKHNKHSKLTKKIEGIAHDGLCPKCAGIIKWRKKYRKYKPLKAPKKCGACQQKTVVRAYHVICRSCHSKKDVCSKCLLSRSEWKEIVPEGEEKEQELDEEEAKAAEAEKKAEAEAKLTRKALKEKLKDPNLKERERRTIQRKLDNMYEYYYEDE